MSEPPSSAPNLFPVDQIGIVVRDLDQAVERYDRVMGGGPWRIWTYGPENVPTRALRGAEAAFELRIALSSGRPQIELIESLAGPNIYEEWLERHGEGLHHLARFSHDLEADIEQLERRGFSVLQQGRGYGLGGDGAFVYFDTVSELGVILELVEVPARRREPESVWSSDLGEEAAG